MHGLDVSLESGLLLRHHMCGVAATQWQVARAQHQHSSSNLAEAQHGKQRGQHNQEQRRLQNQEQRVCKQTHAAVGVISQAATVPCMPWGAPCRHAHIAWMGMHTLLPCHFHVVVICMHAVTEIFVSTHTCCTLPVHVILSIQGMSPCLKPL